MIQFLIATVGAFWLLHRWTAPKRAPAPAPVPKEPAQPLRPDAAEAPLIPEDLADAADAADGDSEGQETVEVEPPPAKVEVNPFRKGQKRMPSPMVERRAMVRGSMDDLLPSHELEGPEIEDQFEDEDEEVSLDGDVEEEEDSSEEGG